MTYTKQTWTDEELADVALYDIKESDDTPINEGVKIELATDVIIAGSGVTAERMGHMEDGIYDAHTDIAALTTKVNDANDLKLQAGRLPHTQLLPRRGSISHRRSISG